MSEGTKVVKTQSKGMVTIPVEFREKLGIEANSLLEAHLVDDTVVFMKLDVRSKSEIYTEDEIKEWMDADKIDAKTAKKLAKLLK